MKVWLDFLNALVMKKGRSGISRNNTMLGSSGGTPIKTDAVIKS